MGSKKGMKLSPNSLKNLKPIRPGEVRNPDGGRTHDPVKKALRSFTNEYLKEVIEAAVMGDLLALKEIIDDEKSPAIKVGVAKSVLKAIEYGDWTLLNSIIERIVGKIPNEIKLSGSVGNESESDVLARIEKNKTLLNLIHDK